MIRIGKLAPALAVGLALVVGCGSNTVTPSASPSPTAPAVATATPSTTPSVTPVAPSPTAADPDALFNLAILEGPAWQTFHLKITVTGSITVAALKASGNQDWAKITSAAKLDGTTIEGDMDPSRLACNLAISVPGTSINRGVPFTGDAIILDPTIYLKTSSGGSKYFEGKLGTLANDLGKLYGFKVSIPAPGKAALVSIANTVATFRKWLDASGFKPTLVGIDKIGGKDAYHVQLSVPLDKLDRDIATQAAKPGASYLKKVKVDSASAALWIYKDTYQLAQVQVSAASSAVGTLGFQMTLTDFGKSVNITAPPASQIAK